MLDSEQAQAELKKLENKQWVEVSLDSAARLPEGLRERARGMLGAYASLDIPTQKQLGQKLLEAFLSMNDAERLGYFEALFLELAPAVERGWQLMNRLPYQWGWARKPFRAPNHADLLLSEVLAEADRQLPGSQLYEKRIRHEVRLTGGSENIY